MKALVKYFPETNEHVQFIDEISQNLTRQSLCLGPVQPPAQNRWQHCRGSGPKHLPCQHCGLQFTLENCWQFSTPWKSEKNYLLHLNGCRVIADLDYRRPTKGKINYSYGTKMTTESLLQS